MKMPEPLALLVIAANLLPLPVTAEDGKLAEDGQVWGSVLATGNLGRSRFSPSITAQPDSSPTSFRYWLEGNGRFGNEMSSLSQGMIRPALGYTLSDQLSVWMGYAYIYTDAPFATKAFDEHRLWQQVLWNQALGPFTFTSRSRMEQRFANTGDDAAWRFRQYFKLTWPLSCWKHVSLVTSNETFVNLNNADWGVRGGLDQNRAFLGIGYTFNKFIKSEIGYVNQFISRPTTPDRMSHIMGLNLLINYPGN